MISNYVNLAANFITAPDSLLREIIEKDEPRQNEIPIIFFSDRGYGPIFVELPRGVQAPPKGRALSSIGFFDGSSSIVVHPRRKILSYPKERREEYLN